MKQLLTWSKPSTIATIAKELKGGNVILATSDTVLGLLAPATQQGFAALNTMKGRPADKPYLLLAHSIETIEPLVEEIPDYARVMMQACWPGPLTLIFKAKKEIPAYMQSKENTLAVRIPHHQGLLHLLSLIPLLFSTSANKAGEPVPESMEQVDPEISAQSKLVVIDAESDKKISLVPSTIIDCTGMKAIIVREGLYSRQQIETLIGHHLK